MPKEVLKIEDFSAGLNSYSDPRDIEDNQLTKADNINVSKVGTLASSSKVDVIHSIGTYSITAPPAGTGLFSFSHDYHSPGAINYVVNDDTGFDSAGTWTFSNMELDDNQLLFDPSAAETATATQARADFDSTTPLENSGAAMLSIEIAEINTSGLTSIKILSSGGLPSSDITIPKELGHHLIPFTFGSGVESSGDLKIQCISSNTNPKVRIDNLYVMAGITAQRTNYFVSFNSALYGSFNTYTPDGGSLNWNPTSKSPGSIQSQALLFGSSTVSGTSIPNYSYFDGVLRVCDSNFTNQNLPLWRGYIDRPLLGNDTASDNDMGRIPGFYNYTSIAEKPEWGPGTTVFNDTGGSPTFSGTSGNQIGLSIELTSFSAVEMIAGFAPNSTEDGLNDAAYDVLGNYGGGDCPSGLSGGDITGGNDEGRVAGSTNYTMGENYADLSGGDTTLLGHSIEEGHYLYPKAISAADDVNSHTVMPFFMGDRAFRFSFGNGDTLSFEIKGFGQDDNSWSKSLNGTDDGHFWMGFEFMGADETTANTNESIIIPTVDAMDNKGAHPIRYSTKVDKSFSNDGAWHTITFSSDFYSGNASDSTINYYMDRHYCENYYIGASHAVEDHLEGLEASLFGIGRGFRLFPMQRDNYFDGDNKGLNTHITPGASSGGVSNDGAHFGIRNIRISRGAGSASYNDVGNSLGEFDFYYSFLYDDNKIESNLTKMNSTKKTIFEQSDFKFRIYAKRDYSSNRRVTGARIYFRRDDEVDKFMLCDVDMRLGTKKPGDADYEPWTVNSKVSPFSVQSDLISFGGEDGREFKNSFITYKSNVGSSGNFINYRWKTATVLNRRMYLGNVARVDDTGLVLEKYGDRLVKSIPNQLDRFHEDSFVEVVVQDGDEIIKLESFAERILQFKRKTLYIINVSGDVEFLEGEYKYLGVSNECQVVATEIGVFWINNKGLHLYDGQKIHDLTEGRINAGDFITDDETNIPSITYQPLEKKVYILNNTIATGGATDYGSGWVFCLKTFSFVKLAEVFPNTNATASNFITADNGDVVYQVGNGSWYEIGTSPSNIVGSGATNNKSFHLETKDFTFGDSGVLKKIHKIYITYKMPSNDSYIKVSGAKNGSADFSDITFAEHSATSNYDGTSGFDQSSSWATAIIKPSASLSCYSLQLKIYASDEAQGYIQNFEINDMSIVYRKKTVK